MEWLQSINMSIRYIEDNLENELSVADVSNKVYASKAHFQHIFNLVTGITIGEYIRNRRLSLAGRDLLDENNRVIDIAMKYQYNTPESFSKAFSRFHGISPSEVRTHRNMLKFYYPLTINISIQGGFDMANRIIDEFYWNDINGQTSGKMTNKDKYQRIVNWAVNAREQNPGVFDSLTEWILDDSEWSCEKLNENKEILMEGVLARFKGQNGKLRKLLKELEPSGVVNKAVFKALDRFDEELSGNTLDKELQGVVSKVFKDFSVMENRGIREVIAGNKTGPTGTENVDAFGYINCLKECDAGVQWALFMPAVVQEQQQGFKVESFKYRKIPAMRFIGFEGEEYADVEKRINKMKVIEGLSAYKSDFEYDVLFMHHYGLGVDVGPWHGVWGRFMKAGTPVPEGFIYFDFLPDSDGKAGPPYISQFAYAVFSGDMEAMHSRKGYDSDAMYDVTRNIILGQGISIPYPHKYWTAEVFRYGCDKYSDAYMFSIVM